MQADHPRRLLAAAALCAAAVLAGPLPARSQPIILVEDIPASAGQVSVYAVQADTNATDSTGIAFDPGPEGGSQIWSFELGQGMMQHADSVLDLASAPGADQFPGALRAVRGFLPAFSGLGPMPFSADLVRFESVTGNFWSLAGLNLHLSLSDSLLPDSLLPDSVNVGQLDLTWPLESPVRFSQLPLTYQASWSVTDTLDTVYTDTSGAQALIRLTYGFDAEADAWGDITLPGGHSAQALRLHHHIGGEVNVYPILFGVPIPVPIYNQAFPLSHVYTWLASGYGEVATAVSLPGEEEEQFSEASLLRWLLPEGLAAPEPSAAAPARVQLERAWPNPFNSSTRIRFQLDRAARVELRVYDLLGRRVATLLQQTLRAGSHQLQWNAEGLPSGSYLLRLQAGGESRTMRLQLVR